MIQVFLLPINPIYTQQDEPLKAYLPSNRVDNLERYAFSSDKKNCLFNYLLLEYCIHITFNIDIKTLEFGYGDNHKPILLSHPNIHFNTSHTKGFICCVLSDTPCGIDTENSKRHLPNILNAVFSSSEKTQLNNFISDDVRYSEIFYTMWTLKEAYTKMLGTGLTTNFKEVNTLDNHFIKNALTIKENNFIISIYSSEIGGIEDSNNIIHLLSEDVIYNFYKIN